MIHSDWHIHTEASYDAALPVETLITQARAQGLRCFGMTDHVNFNDEKFLGDLKNSAELFNKYRAVCPEMVLGAELTPIEKPLFDYIAKTGTREGYIPVIQDAPYEIELPVTKEELKALGARYAVGAAHWRVDIPNPGAAENALEDVVKEWLRQQLWLIQDERVTILGHPWYIGSGLWYQDFSVIPQSMHEEMAAALLEYGKFAECNSGTFRSPKGSEKFRYQYAEYLRFLFEKGVPITYGSDCHGKPNGEYPDNRVIIEPYLTAAGFREGDFSDLTEADLW